LQTVDQVYGRFFKTSPPARNLMFDSGCMARLTWKFPASPPSSEDRLARGESRYEAMLGLSPGAGQTTKLNF
jgi:hypothetical protein